MKKQTYKACYEAVREYLWKSRFRARLDQTTYAVRMLDKGERLAGKTVNRACVALFDGATGNLVKRLTPRAFEAQVMSEE